MKVRYQFRFYPTNSQKDTLARVFGCCRYVYNRALRLRTDAWQNEQRKIGYHETSKMLTAWKREEDTKWLAEVSSVATQQALRHLQTAFINFWNKTARYPSFKKKHNRQSAEYTQHAFRYDAGNLSVSGLGRLDVHWSRDFESLPTTVTITKSPSGRYFVTLCLDEAVQQMPKTGKLVGVDLGVSRLATLSTGERIPNPRYLYKKQSKLKRAQRVLARKAKGSGRRERQRLKVARLHERIADARKDHLDKVTTDLVRRFDRIQIEDLNVRGMVKNHCLARAISDVGMGMFRRMLDYKCRWYGKELVLVDRWYPSSKRCSDCGHVVESLSLSVREWVCPECGVLHDRDENAAKNLKYAEGHSVKARGETVRRSGPRPRAAGFVEM